MKKLASFVLITLSVCCALSACSGHNDDNSGCCNSGWGWWNPNGF